MLLCMLCLLSDTDYLKVYNTAKAVTLYQYPQSNHKKRKSLRSTSEVQVDK